MLNKLKSIYEHLPKSHLRFLKNTPNRILFGESYYRTNPSFEKTVIEKNLCKILNYSRDHTQYGKDNIPKEITPENSKEVLESLPLISSRDISSNLSYFSSNEYNRTNSYLTTTGGTGRNPTPIALSNESYGIEWAHMHRIWALAGYDRLKHLKMTLRGKSLQGQKLVEYNPLYNELIVDTFKVNSSNFQQLLKEIRNYRISYIHGYPSLVKEFIEYFEKYGEKPELRGVFLGSEGSDKSEKKYISDYFNCKVIHWYGQTEKVALAVDTESNDNFKIYTSYGYPRVVDGEIVSTTFVNKALPLINYKTGDGAKIQHCDNHITLTDIQGRWGKDFVYVDNQKKIPTSSINLHSDIQNEILFYQINQSDFSKIQIKVIQKKSSKISKDELCRRLHEEMKRNLKDFEITVKPASESEIIKSHRGKMIMLVQEIDLNRISS